MDISTEQFWETLVIEITNKCNLNCYFCPVDKNNYRKLNAVRANDTERMVGLFLSLDSKSKLERIIKFQGGEPLFYWEIISHFIKKYASARNRFVITSNGHMLDRKILDFFKEHNQFMDLVISIDVEKWDIESKYFFEMISSLEENCLVGRIIYNVTITPFLQNKIVKLIKLLVKKGAMEIRLSPAFYVNWTKNQLNELFFSFKRISEIIDDRYGRWIKLPSAMSRLVNFLDRFSNITGIPLINDSLTLNHNGEVFTSGIFLLNYFTGIRSKFKLGDIRNLSICKRRIVNLKEDKTMLQNNLKNNYLLYNMLVPSRIRKTNNNLLIVYGEYVKLRVKYFRNYYAG